VTRILASHKNRQKMTWNRESMPLANQPSKVAVLGLDGVPYTLLEHLCQNGIMPRLSQAAEAGTFLRMTTTLPPVSSVAWTSFMTGANPGSHGIFGFTDVKPRDIALHLPSFDDIQCPPVWQRVPHKTTLVVNLPFTYPARPLNGVLIAGFVAPIFDRSVYPERLIPWLKSRDYRIDVDAIKGRGDRHALMGDLFDTLNHREEVMLSLMETEPWDLFIGVITGTDRLHHFFYDAYWAPTHPFHQDFINYYRRVDTFFGRFVDSMGIGTRLIVLSDHGFTRLRTQVYVNHLLKKMGYLFFTSPEPTSPEQIHPQSLAFALDPSRIYLNRRDRFKHGALSPEAADAFRETLKGQLAEIRLGDLGINGLLGEIEPHEHLFSHVMARDEVYRGDLLSMAPDLVLIPNPGFDLKARLNAPTATMTDIFTGMHNHDDAFLMVNDAQVAERLPKPEITDVAGLILETIG
jgi:predicted AlkP superfamily phosphohydrolase/phosphomutase